jgi:hypothetical protein
MHCNGHTQLDAAALSVQPGEGLLMVSAAAAVHMMVLTRQQVVRDNAGKTETMNYVWA